MAVQRMPATTAEALELARPLLEDRPEQLQRAVLKQIEAKGPVVMPRFFPSHFAEDAQGRAGGSGSKNFPAPPRSPYAGENDVEKSIVEETRLSEADALGQHQDIGFMMRALALSGMPHSEPGANEFRRQNGNFTFSMVVDSSIGLPYGVPPRLICLWLTTAVRQARDPFVSFGKSLSEFMRNCGVQPITGRKGNMAHFRDQLIRLAATNFTAFFESGKKGERGLRIQKLGIFEEAAFWWNQRDDERFDAYAQVSHAFYEDITKAVVPVSLEAIQQLKSSAFALDLYIWSTYRLHSLGKPVGLPWEFIRAQFGADYESPYEFKRKFRKVLARVLQVYPEAKIMATNAQVLLQPSPPHVRRLKDSVRGTGS